MKQLGEQARHGEYQDVHDLQPGRHGRQPLEGVADTTIQDVDVHCTQIGYENEDVDVDTGEVVLAQDKHDYKHVAVSDCYTSSNKMATRTR